MAIFENNVVVLTGASSGIGLELALQLAEQGAHLVLAARNGKRLAEVAESCRQKGGKAIVCETDVADEQQCKALIENTLAEYGRLDTLINNAGISMYAMFDELHDLSSMKPIMEVNYYGSVYCTHYALPHLKKTRGRIVGISSLTGKTGVPTRCFYAASKHAMMGFFDTLRIELAETGVSVTMICPGFVTSEVRSRSLGPDGKPIGESPVQEDKVMIASECARQIIVAGGSRHRELVMTTKGKIGMWLKLIAPGTIDKIAMKTIQKGR